MSDIIIKAENLGKSYIIGHEKREQYVALRDVVTSKAKQIAQKTRQMFKGGQLIAGDELEEFWALKNIYFELQRGDRIGIIGRNGAGKSTLLKVLSRITEPSTGRVIMRGRVASLLEVGTGFHPELTGRENIYLNGAILGMSQVEIRKKFDEIVHFSGVEKFLDTPVKRYSSGMYVRLAFAVAAHLETEILIVDEVLAVGDAEFQKKCMGKMDEISKGEGRTVVFVSHNMGAITDLCESVFVLKEGTIVFNGPTNDGVSLYLDKYCSPIQTLNHDRGTLKKINQFVILHNADPEHKIQNEFKHDDEIRIVFEVYLPDWDDRLEVGLSPCDKYGRRIFTIDVPLRSFYNGNPFIKLEVMIPPCSLVAGNYSWMIFIHHPLVTLFDYQESVCKFSILETGSVFSRYSGYDFGCVYPPKFLIQKIQND
ncbi:MAG: polysaccharide ABC transporter ATP-binding protein [Methanococcaceae archaeon]